MNILPLIVSGIGEAIPDDQYEFWRDTRPERLGWRVEDMIPSAEAKPVLWKKVVDVFTLLGGWLAANGGEGQFVMGERISWADLLIMNWLFMMRRLWGVEDERWKELMTLDEGRWKKFVEAVGKYERVDEEGLATLSL